MYASSFNATWNRGLTDEKLVIDWLVDQGHAVEASTKDENKYQDIDCWVNGKPFSIKTMHAGLCYGNIGMELASQLTAHKDCDKTKAVIKDLYIMTPSQLVNTIDDLVAHGSWEYGWYANGKADFYLILRGHHLHLYKKAHIQKYVSQNGWQKVRPLSRDVKATQGGMYRYCDTISGYLQTNTVANRIWDISEFLDRAC